MEKQGYTFEADYIRVVLNWRQACDERGLTELQRCRFNYQMYNYILDDLMPWHRQYDFSHLEVNLWVYKFTLHKHNFTMHVFVFFFYRSVSSVCGFTRETLNAMIANIEGREFRRVLLYAQNIPPEHPRACSTDDVECFFSVLRDILGSDFSLKRVQYAWKRTCLEFSKRVDPDLPISHLPTIGFMKLHDQVSTFLPKRNNALNEPEGLRC